jgi:hypothetical protein
MLVNCRIATQLVASQVMLITIELVSWLFSYLVSVKWEEIEEEVLWDDIKGGPGLLVNPCKGRSV